MSSKNVDRSKKVCIATRNADKKIVKIRQDKVYITEKQKTCIEL